MNISPMIQSGPAKEINIKKVIILINKNIYLSIPGDGMSRA
jgi:hypothetical protein